MGIEINLMDVYPKTKRNLAERIVVSEADRQLARQFGKEYFDGPRHLGMGGYYYNGWFKPVVKRFADYYGLNNNSSVLDVGAAKGFMLHDFKEAFPGMTVAGIDISQYCYDNSMEDVREFLQVGDCASLPYADKSFDLVISISTIHNHDLDGVKRSLVEIERVKKQHAWIKVNAWRNDEEREAIEAWNLVAKTSLHVDDWLKLFKEVGYTGDYFWFNPMY